MTSQTAEIVTHPKNRGILARELTEACRAAWLKSSVMHAVYHLDQEPKIREAENAIVHRIGDLEQQVELQAKVITRLREAAHEMQRQVAGAIKIVGPLPKAEEIF